MNIVLDTNVLVSALWSSDSKPAGIVNAVLGRRFTACYDYRIINEYYNVLRRPKFHFSEWEIQSLLEFITSNGISVVPAPLPDIYFADKTDRKFYEVAAFCHARLITGNIKHYPQDSCVITVADFCKMYLV
ncbi:MAG: putative toxin-antitoxin system toxin component, PIN family [Clostridium sp.]|nr:putative toxin-antitoxin system toxin component, PIN family [Clostridium sp.]